MAQPNAPALSQSIARTLLSRSPYHAWHEHPALGGLRRKPTKEMATGTLVHQLVLGGDDVVQFDYPDWKTKKAREDRDATLALSKTPILRKQIDSAQFVVDAIREAIDCAGLSPSLFECEKRLHWEYGRIPCMGTPDAVLVEEQSAAIWELKTTKQIGNCLDTGRNGAKSGWAIQREAYVTAIETLHPHVAGRVEFHWVIAEVEAPYQVRIVPARGSMRELGRLQWERAVVLWGELLKRGWSKPWRDEWRDGLEAPEYELVRERAALDELLGEDE